MRPLTVLLLAATLSAAGCGDGDDEEATTTAAPVTTATTAPLVPEPALATAALLTPEDLGGWSTPGTGGSSACLAPVLDAVQPVAAATPNAFGPGTPRKEARSGAWAYADAEAAQRAFAAASDPGLRDCFNGATRTALGTQTVVDEVADVTTEDLPFEPVGDESSSSRTRATIRAGGLDAPIEVYADVVLVRAGSVVAAYQFVSQGSPVDPALAQAAVEAAVARVGTG